MLAEIENYAWPFLALLVLILPIAHRKKPIDIFEPIWFFIIAFVFGGFLRSLWLLSSDAARDMYNLTPNDIRRALLFSALGFSFFQLGYHHPIARAAARKCPTLLPSGWSQKRLKQALFLAVASGLFFLLYFIIESGGLPTELHTLSYKRRISNNYICWGAMLLSVGCVLYLIHMYKNHLRTRKHYFRLFLLAAAASVFPLLSSNRLDILTLLFILIVYSHYLAKKLNLKKILLISLLITFFLLVMVQFRQAYRTRNVQLANAFKPDTLVSFLVESHYFFDITTSSLIVKHTPSVLQYQKGKSLINWLFFPIPRSIWPAKPVNLGRTLSSRLYGEQLGIQTGGIAPPFMFELYLNFKLVGILAGMFGFGILSKTGYLNLIYHKTPVTLAFHALNLQLIYGLFIRDLTWNLVVYLQWMIPLFLLLFFITYPKQNVPAKSILP